MRYFLNQLRDMKIKGLTPKELTLKEKTKEIIILDRTAKQYYIF
jgi:hypothetical protein